MSEKAHNEEKEDHQNTEGETDEGNSSNVECDQVSEASFLDDTDEDIGTAENEEEEWIELKISTKDAEEKMRAANIPGWIETRR